MSWLVGVVATSLVAAGHTDTISFSAGFTNLAWGTHTLNQKATVSGQWPSWLSSGALFRNGPGLWQEGNATHWFDGLGIVHSFRFSAGPTVTFSRQFIKSSEYNQSAPHATINAKGSHGEDEPVPSLYKADAAPDDFNTNVLIRRMGGHYLTATGVEPPNEFSPLTLDTLQTPFEFDDNMQLPPGAAPSHGAYDPDGTFWHYACVFGGPQTGYNVYSIAPGSTTRKPLTTIKPHKGVPVPLFSHALAVTERYVIVIEQPCTYGLKGWSTFEWIAELPTTWHVISKATGAEVATLVTSPAFFFFHIITAFEDESGNPVVDLLPYNNNSVIDALYLDHMQSPDSKLVALGRACGPTRFTLNVTASPGSAVVGKPLVDAAAGNMELPRINDLLATKPYRFVYGIHASSSTSVYYDSLVKVDVTSGNTSVYNPGEGKYPGEALFVPRPTNAVSGLAASAGAEDDGVLLSVVLDASAGESFLAVIDAGSMTELARASVGTVVPFGFHGEYYADA